MRRTTVLLTALALVGLPAPAFAQSPTPSNCNSGGGVRVSPPSPRTVVAGEIVTVTLSARGEVDNAYVSFAEGYRWITPSQRGPVQFTTPEPSRKAQEITPLAQGESATATVTIRPTTNTRVKVGFGFRAGCMFADGFSYPKDEVIDVAPRLTIDAVRNGVRDYTFSGEASRPGQILSLYRVTATGSNVLTSQARATDAGTWTIHRKFLGSGRFGFVLRTGRDMANAPGASRVRDTVIH
jgi:hypothetical protein